MSKKKIRKKVIVLTIMFVISIIKMQGVCVVALECDTATTRERYNVNTAEEGFVSEASEREGYERFTIKKMVKVDEYMRSEPRSTTRTIKIEAPTLAGLKVKIEMIIRRMLRLGVTDVDIDSERESGWWSISRTETVTHQIRVFYVVYHEYEITYK